LTHGYILKVHLCFDRRGHRRPATDKLPITFALEEKEMKEKCVVLAVIFAMALSPTFLAAEDQTSNEVQNAISMDLAMPILSLVNLLGGWPILGIPANIHYQRVISDHLALLIQAGLKYSWLLPYASTAAVVHYGGNWRALEVYPEVEVDWRPFHKGLDGFYLGLSGIMDYVATYSDAAATNGTTHAFAVGMGFNVGWQFLLPNILMDLGLGVGYGYWVNIDVNGAMTSSFEFIPRDSRLPPRFHFGFRF
jgi:hypothetical protein